MDTLHATSAILADWMLETTVHVAILFALVLGTCAVLGQRLTARWRHALWALVLVRLLLPALPASPASVHNVARFVPAAAATVDPSVAARPASAPLDGKAVAQLVPSVAGAVTAPSTPAWPWRTAFTLVWAAGAAVVLGRLLFAELRFARRVRSEPECDDPRVLAALGAALQEARVRRRVRVVETDLGDGPALTGLCAPRILIPRRVLDRLSDEELRHVLAHEVAHLAAGDVLQNWLLAVLERLHWFNPLVRIAGARVRTERETLRDLAATRGAPQEGRAAYGRTLLRLLETGTRRASPPMAVGLFERRGDLRRRIEMIAKGSGGRRAWMLGAGLTAVVAAVALTGASPDPVRAQDDEERAAEPLESLDSIAYVTGSSTSLAFQEVGPRIEVVRRSEPPAWQARVDAALAKKTSVNLNETAVVDLLEYMSRVTGLNIVVHPDARAEAEESLVTLTLESVSSEQALRLSLNQADLTYGVVDGVLHVGHDGQVRPHLDQRFYKIAPLVDRFVSYVPGDWDDEEKQAYRESLPEDIISLAMSFAADQDSWSRTGVSMAMWGDVIVVEQDEAGHRDLESFLNLLLTRGAGVPPSPAWRTALEEKLAQQVSFDFQGARLADVVAYLAQVCGASMVVAPDAGADTLVTLKLTDVTVMEAVNWVARQTRLHAAFADGVVVLTESPPVVVRAYDLAGRQITPKGGTYDGLMELIVSSVAPTTWEEFGRLEYFSKMLIVRNTESAHAQIAEFLEVARRASGE